MQHLSASSVYNVRPRVGAMWRNGRKTMDEYIKREATIKAMEKADYTAIADDADSCKADYLREIIESVPAADVVPVVHGKWMPFHSEAAGDIQYCSACEIGFDAKTDYCPHCGAKMDGGADND